MNEARQGSPLAGSGFSRHARSCATGSRLTYSAPVSDSYAPGGTRRKSIGLALFSYVATLLHNLNDTHARSFVKLSPG